MRVYVLRFSSPGPLRRAFDRVIEAERVASCTIEPEEGRIRLVAPARAAELLVERIYQDGGLVWCSRHDVVVRRELAELAPLAGRAR